MTLLLCASQAMFSIRQVSGGELTTVHFTNVRLKSGKSVMMEKDMSEVEE